MNKAVASKAGLIKAKEDLKLLEMGLDILDKKRKALISAHDSKINKRDELNKRVESSYKKISPKFERALASMGESKLRDLSKLIPIDNSIRLSTTKFMQTETASIEYEESKLSLSYSFYQTNHLLDEALISFNDLRSDIFSLAELDSSINKLEMEIKKASKKVNSLEKMQIPQKRKLIKEISSKLEEKEREEFSKTKIVKNNKEKNHRES